MRRYFLIALLIAGGCVGETNSTDPYEPVPFSLFDAIYEVGNELELPTGPGQFQLAAIVLDTDDNGKGDGMDINDDDIAEITYEEDQKSLAREDVFEFQIDGWTLFFANNGDEILLFNENDVRVEFHILDGGEEPDELVGFRPTMMGNGPPVNFSSPIALPEYDEEDDEEEDD